MWGGTNQREVAFNELSVIGRGRRQCPFDPGSACGSEEIQHGDGNDLSVESMNRVRENFHCGGRDVEMAGRTGHASQVEHSEMVAEERGRRKVDRLFNDVVRNVRESADRRIRSDLVDWIDLP